MPNIIAIAKPSDPLIATDTSETLIATATKAAPILIARWKHVLTDATAIATGTDADEVIEARGGHDTVFGKGGDDLLLGEAGDDMLSGGDGKDEMRGGIGHDVLDGGAHADVLIGGTGDDTYIIRDLDIVGYDPSTESGLLYGSLDKVVEAANEGYDTVITTLRSMTLAANVEALTAASDVAGGVYFLGNALDNTILGSDFGDLLAGLDGDDVLDGDGGADTLQGGNGDDVYWVQDKTDQVIEYQGQGKDAVWTTLNAYTLSAAVETLTYVGQPLGLVFGFKGTGNELDNTIIGAGADDTLSGLTGDDLLNGGAGNDVLLGGEGNDLLVGALGADTMKGQAGNDSYKVDSVLDVVVEAKNAGTDTVYTTLLSYTLGAHVENLTADTTFAFTGTGNALDNTITGNQNQDKLFGLAGDDLLQGLGGKDTLDGGTGDDLMFGGEGDDTYVVDSEGDAAFEIFGTGIDTVLSTTTSWTLLDGIENLLFTTGGFHHGRGNAAANTLSGNTGVDDLYGLDGDDWLDGGAGQDKLFGGKNNDTAYGGADDDQINGEDGDDWLNGEAGKDVVKGGMGADILYGGADADIFAFASVWESTVAGTDRIRDFGYGDDVIALGDIDAATNVAGNQAFAFIGTAGFSGAAGELRYSVSGAFTSIYGDTNGDKIADLAIVLDGQHALTASDFYL